MPTPKNVFQILNLHPKKHVFEKMPFFNVLLPKFYREKVTSVGNKISAINQSHIIYQLAIIIFLFRKLGKKKNTSQYQSKLT